VTEQNVVAYSSRYNVIAVRAMLIRPSCSIYRTVFLVPTYCQCKIAVMIMSSSRSELHEINDVITAVMEVTSSECDDHVVDVIAVCVVCNAESTIE